VNSFFVSTLMLPLKEKKNTQNQDEIQSLESAIILSIFIMSQSISYLPKRESISGESKSWTTMT